MHEGAEVPGKLLLICYMFGKENILGFGLLGNCSGYLFLMIKLGS